MNELGFDAWLEHGIKMGYCSEEFCFDHDVPPMTPEEAEWKNQQDELCILIVRLW